MVRRRWLVDGDWYMYVGRIGSYRLAAAIVVETLPPLAAEPEERTERTERTQKTKRTQKTERAERDRGVSV